MFKDAIGVCAAHQYRGIVSGELAPPCVVCANDRLTREVERLTALQSQEVCTVAHSAEVMAFCPYCKIEDLTAKLLEIAGECAECGGTGSVQCGDDPRGWPAMFPCDACWDIREAAGCS
jgi:hypothetical protein